MSFDKMFDLTAGVYFNFYNSQKVLKVLLLSTPKEYLCG